MNVVIIIIVIIIVVTIALIASILIARINKLKLSGSGLDDCFKTTILNNKDYFEFYVDNKHDQYYNKLVINNNIHVCSWFLSLKLLKDVISDEHRDKLIVYEKQINENENSINEIIDSNEYQQQSKLIDDIKNWVSSNQYGTIKDLKERFAEHHLSQPNEYFTQKDIDDLLKVSNAKEFRTYLRAMQQTYEYNLDKINNNIKNIESEKTKYNKLLRDLWKTYTSLYDKPFEFISIENNEKYNSAHRFKCAFTEIYLLLILSYSFKKEIHLKINSINNNLIESMDNPDFVETYFVKFLNYNYNGSDSVKNINIFNEHIKQLQQHIIDLTLKNEITNPISDSNFKEEYHVFKLTKNNLMECINKILTIHNIKLKYSNNKINFDGNTNTKYQTKLYNLLNGSNILGYDVNPDILLFM